MRDDLTAEEKALLAASETGKKKTVPPRRRTDDEAAAAAPAPTRGPITPVQWDDDGWGDTPIQMRG